MNVELSDPNVDRQIFPFKSLIVYPYQKFDGPFNMALDYYFTQTMAENQSPILRFYGWQPYCLSLGYHQNKDFIDLQALQSEGYQAVRRPTGGSAIFHSEELTYGFILPNQNINNHDIYYLFHKYLTQALNQLNFPVTLNYQKDRENYLRQGKKRFACFNRPAFAEIKFNDKKVVGSAQKLYRKALLQHGSILIGNKQKEIIKFMNATDDEKQKYLAQLEAKSISLSEITPQNTFDLNLLIERFLIQFEQNLHLTIYFASYDLNHLRNAQKFVDNFKIQ